MAKKVPQSSWPEAPPLWRSCLSGLSVCLSVCRWAGHFQIWKGPDAVRDTSQGFAHVLYIPDLRSITGESITGDSPSGYNAPFLPRPILYCSSSPSMIIIASMCMQALSWLRSRMRVCTRISIPSEAATSARKRSLTESLNNIILGAGEKGLYIRRANPRLWTPRLWTCGPGYDAPL